jgi:hypothetical protein
MMQTELKRRWDAKADVLVEAIKELRTAERLRRLLESSEGTKQ